MQAKHGRTEGKSAEQDSPKRSKPNQDYNLGLLVEAECGKYLPFIPKSVDRSHYNMECLLVMAQLCADGKDQKRVSGLTKKEKLVIEDACKIYMEAMAALRRLGNFVSPDL